MKGKLKIYNNGVQVNEFDFEGERAYLELSKVLLDKLNKRYKAKLQTDSVYREIKAKLSFEVADRKYVYDYVFTEVDNSILL